MTIPWEYMKLSELMAGVKSGLQTLDDSGMIDDDRVIPIVMACNEKLGEKIFRSIQCTTTVDNFKADIPTDMFKIENIFAISTTANSIIRTNPLISGARQLEFSLETPINCNTLVGTMTAPCPADTCTPPCTLTDFNKNYYVTSKPKNELLFTYQNIRPLILGKGITNKCTNYCPSTRWKGEYQADIVNGEFELSFEKGELYISYLGNMIDADGDILIPKHPLLNDYYKYAIIENIFEDMYLNSEADILQRLQYTTEHKKESYSRAWNFINSAQVGQFSKLKKKWEMDYYNEWYKAF